MRIASVVALLIAAVLAAGVPPCCLLGAGHCCAAEVAEAATDTPACPHCPREEPEEQPAPVKTCECGDDAVALAHAGKPAHLDGPVLATVPAAAVAATPAVAIAVAPRPEASSPNRDEALSLPLLL
mgnify:CR=1 FL=1